jgi:hypothetical protein|tara:strand:- start:74 stop:316 length:243 start_codon:yes stop_codon:yes gene_type:complete
VDDNIVSLTDLIETRLRKEQEIEYYMNALTQLQKKIKYLQKDVNITILIIDLIEKEKIMTLDEKALKLSNVVQLVDKEND